MHTGQIFKRRGQRYECVDRFGYERPAQFTWVYTLEGCCPDCGRGFTFTASATQINKGQLSRRCERCRDPGRPVQLPPVKGATHSKSAAPKRNKPAPLAKAANWRSMAPLQAIEKPAPVHNASLEAVPPEVADQPRLTTDLAGVGEAANLADCTAAQFDTYAYALGLSDAVSGNPS